MYLIIIYYISLRKSIFFQFSWFQIKAGERRISPVLSWLLRSILRSFTGFRQSNFWMHGSRLNCMVNCQNASNLQTHKWTFNRICLTCVFKFNKIIAICIALCVNVSLHRTTNKDFCYGKHFRISQYSIFNSTAFKGDMYVQKQLAETFDKGSFLAVT